MNKLLERRAKGAKNILRRSFQIIVLTKLLGGLLVLSALSATGSTVNVNLAWNTDTSAGVTGYNVYYGQASGDYTSVLDAGSNLTESVAGLTPGVTYYFASTAYDANGDESAFSNEVTNTIPIAPSILTQPASQTVIAGTAAALWSAVTGTAPLSMQWYFGTTALAGATNSALTWASIATSNAGNYYLTVANAGGAVTSSVATLTVIVPPSILTQPQSESVIAGIAASFSSAVSGTAPLSMQWFFGGNALAGATSSTLAWASAAASNAGNYYFTVANAGGAVTSSVATLTILPTNTTAVVAGAYNGLFFQTNANELAATTEATAGFLGNCVVASNGAFSAKLYLAGASYPLAGMFNSSGSASATIIRANAGASNLTAVLQLDSSNGTQQITGAISSTANGSDWTSPLLGDLATNAFPTLTEVNLVISPGLSTNSPTNFGTAIGVVSNSVLSLSGTLGDKTAFSQTVPIAADGTVPIYVNLYTNGGLLEGWINLAGGAATGNLTWIRPGGVLTPAGFPQGFDTVVQVTGTSYQEGLGYLAMSGPGTCTFSGGVLSTSGWIVFQDTNGSQYYAQANGWLVSFNALGSLTFWSCAGKSNSTPSGVITHLGLNGYDSTLTSLNVSGLTGLTSLVCESLVSLTSINASGCASLTSLNCEYCDTSGTTINASNCTALASLSDLGAYETVAVQNATIATLPPVTTGTHTLTWASAPSNPAGDAAAIAKGWTVIR